MLVNLIDNNSCYLSTSFKTYKVPNIHYLNWSDKEIEEEEIMWLSLGETSNQARIRTQTSSLQIQCFYGLDASQQILLIGLPSTRHLIL